MSNDISKWPKLALVLNKTTNTKHIVYYDDNNKYDDNIAYYNFKNSKKYVSMSHFHGVYSIFRFSDLSFEWEFIQFIEDSPVVKALYEPVE